MIFGNIPKEELETTIKKSANGRYFEKENIECTALESEDDVSEYICVFVHFFFPYFGRGTRNCFHKTSCNSRSIDIQTSTGVCWKGNAP